MLNKEILTVVKLIKIELMWRDDFKQYVVINTKAEHNKQRIYLLLFLPSNKMSLFFFKNNPIQKKMYNQLNCRNDPLGIRMKKIVDIINPK